MSVTALFFFLISNVAYGDEEGTRNVLKQGLLGAGTGAIASGASGGNAGTGALIGAGTGVIGGALLDAITAPSSSSSSSRRRSSPQQAQYYDDEEYDDGQEYYEEEEPAQESTGSKVIKQGLLGAGTGAIASGMSGGNAGKGALIGAGTGAIGSVLLDMMTQPSQPKKVYRKVPAKKKAKQVVKVQQPGDEDAEADATGTGTSHKKVVRKYDDSGKVISEEEIYY
jgi:gas vesicle protein